MPLQGLFETVWWVVLGLTAVNFALFAAIVVQREQWVVHRRLRERIARRIAPVVDRLLHGDDIGQAVDELRPLFKVLPRQVRPVTAWLLLDGLGAADAGTQAAVRKALGDYRVIEQAERATRRRMAWRRVLACDVLGTIGTATSVGVLVQRLRDKRAEVRTAAVQALGELGSPAAAAPLTELFLRQDGVPIGVVHDSLSRLGAAGADAFRQGLRSPRVTVRITSCFGIAGQAETVGRGAVIALLEQRLRMDGEACVRAAAASAMRFVPGDAAPAALLGAAHDRAAPVRRSTAKSLAAFDDPAAVEALGPMASDSDRETALRSAESLLVLSERRAAGAQAREALGASHAWTVDSVRATAELGA